MEAAATAPATVTRRFVAVRHVAELLYLFTRRELKLRYQDTVLGFLWTALKPLFFALVIWFAMHKAFKVQTELPYHLSLLSALLPWTWFQTSILFATPLFVNNGALVKKVPFPSYVLPLSTIANNMVHFLLSLPVLVVFLLISGRTPGPEWIIGVPMLLVLELALMMGLALGLSALDVHFRDLEHLVEVLLNLLFYGTPILYPLSFLPQPYRHLMKLNPLSTLMEGWRNLLVSNQLPGMDIWWAVAISAVILALGSWIFSRLRLTFADYL